MLFAEIGAIFSLIGYLFGVPYLYRIRTFAEMALSTAVAFGLLSISILGCYPNEGPLAALSRRTVGGLVARRLMPAAVLVPLLLGWVSLQGERAGNYPFELGLALMVLSMMMTMAVLAFWITHAVDREYTARKYAEALKISEEKYRSVTESANDAVISTDSQGNITFVNAAFESIFGYPQSDVLGQSLTRLMPQRFHQALTAGFNRYLTTGVARVIGKTVELTGLKMSGEEFPMELSLGVWRGADRIWFTAIIRDITERKEAEEQARRLQLLSTRQDFLAALMHNLKNPIIGSDRVFEVLTSNQFKHMSPDLVTTIFSELKQSNRKVLSMMNKLIEIYQYETDPLVLHPHPSDVAELVRSCVNDSISVAEARRIELVTELADDVDDIRVDPNGITRVVENLLDNAIKFSDEGNKVKVVVRKDGLNLVLAVHNYGITISDDERHALFRGFWTGIAGNSCPPGTGLGLYLCKTIVEAHHGILTCTSEEDLGTTFTVLLPIAVRARSVCLDSSFLR